MTLDCDKYRLSQAFVITLASSIPKGNLIPELGMLAIATSVPIIIVVHYLIEVYGPTKDLLTSLETFKKFYGIDEVINVREYKNGSDVNLHVL